MVASTSLTALLQLQQQVTTLYMHGSMSIFQSIAWSACMQSHVLLQDFFPCSDALTDTELSHYCLQVLCPADMGFALRCSFPDHAMLSAAEHLHVQGLLALPGCPPS